MLLVSYHDITNICLTETKKKTINLFLLECHKSLVFSTLRYILVGPNIEFLHLINTRDRGFSKDMLIVNKH